MANVDPIKIEGLAEFSRNLRKLDNDLPKALRVAHNEAADVVANWAAARVPRRSGRAGRSVKARSTRTEGRVIGGGRSVPYYPWLDFGGRVGRSRSVRRPFVKGGRFIYPGYSRQKDKVNRVLLKALLQVAQQAGLDPEGG